MAEFNGFHDLAEQLDELAEEFREQEPVARDPETGQFRSTRGAIQSGVDDAMHNIVKKSRQRARNYVPNDDAETIDHESLGWMGKDTYMHKFYAESDIVTFHEFGTGTKAEHPRYPGTVNAEDADGNQGYLINPPGDQPVAFEDDGQTFVLEYVVHPGVPAQHFMERTLRKNTDKIEQEIADAIDNYFDHIDRSR